uniref:RNA polymerase II elongation factor ELL N-terminal domain-containing protein n=1 Tax=Hippocampus comes TaxID=109280 RepID=A0A3Q2YRW1_HIPCM
MLEENRGYGLSGGSLANVSVFHLKLTDSAATAISKLHQDKVIEIEFRVT